MIASTSAIAGNRTSKWPFGARGPGSIAQATDDTESAMIANAKAKKRTGRLRKTRSLPRRDLRPTRLHGSPMGAARWPLVAAETISSRRQRLVNDLTRGTAHASQRTAAPFPVHHGQSGHTRRSSDRLASCRCASHPHPRELPTALTPALRIPPGVGALDGNRAGLSLGSAGHEVADGIGDGQP